MGKEKTSRKRETPYDRKKDNKIKEDNKMKEDIDKVLTKLRQQTSSSQENQQAKQTQTRTSQRPDLPNEGDTRAEHNDQNKRKRTRRSKRAGARRKSAADLKQLTASFDSLSVRHDDNTEPRSKISAGDYTASSNDNIRPRDKYFNVLVQHITYRMANLYVTAPVKEFKGRGIKRRAEEAEIF